jgi:hypothetical protein
VQLVCRQLKIVTNKIVACHHSALAGRLVDGSAAAKSRVRVINATVGDMTAAAAEVSKSRLTENVGESAPAKSWKISMMTRSQTCQTQQNGGSRIDENLFHCLHAACCCVVDG